MKNFKLLSFILIISVTGIFVSCDGAGTTASDTDTPGVTEMTTLKGTINDEVVKVSLNKAVQQGIGRAAADTVELSGFLVYGDITMDVSGTLDTATGKFNVSSSATFGSTKFVFSLTGFLKSDGTVSDVSISLIVYENDIPAGTYASSLSETEEEVVETAKIADTVEEDLSVFGDWHYEYSDEEYDTHYINGSPVELKELEEGYLNFFIRNTSSFIWTDYYHEVVYNTDGSVFEEWGYSEVMEGSFLYLKKDEAKSTETGKDVYGFILCFDILQELAEDPEDLDFNPSSYPDLELFQAVCGVIAVDGDSCYFSIYEYSYDDEGDEEESSMYVISNYSWNEDHTPKSLSEDLQYYTEDGALCAHGYSDLLDAVGNAEYKNILEMYPLTK